jgi:hypothetical protein
MLNQTIIINPIKVIKKAKIIYKKMNSKLSIIKKTIMMFNLNILKAYKI